MAQKFINKSIEIHSNKYDYSKVVYKNIDTKVSIICPIHGEFNQTPRNHKNGHGCPDCGNISRSKSSAKNIEYFISKSNLIHSDKYDYSKSIYINNKTKLIITCPKHGDFKMTPGHHLSGHGCSSCSNNYRRTSDEFFTECKSAHNNKYIYKDQFKSLKSKITIFCPDHGDFIQTAGHHLNGHGCPKCNTSHGEKYIIDFLENNSVEYIKEKTFNGCLSHEGYKLRFDFYLPNLNMCIEYDGLQHYKPLDYFGGIEQFKNTKMNDEIKNIYCEKNNIGLLRIKYLRPSQKTKNKINEMLIKIMKTQKQH